MTVLSARQGYSRWAAHYTSETAVSALEDRVVESFGIATAGQRLLDVGCGTGRRLDGIDAAVAIGIDYTPQMLAHAATPMPLAAADVRALPFTDASFDVIWCRLVIGHVREVGQTYVELARVCRIGGTIVISDFHPDAVAAGHRRTFRDDQGTLFEIRHFTHEQSDHAAASSVAGLECIARRDGEVGPEIRSFYQSAGRTQAYESQRGLRIVLALAYRRVS